MYQFVGLSLVREFMTRIFTKIMGDEELLTSVVIIRDNIAEWLMSQRNVTMASSSLFNTAVAIYSLSIKALYPERWPTAFSDLLQMGT